MKLMMIGLGLVIKVLKFVRDAMGVSLAAKSSFDESSFEDDFLFGVLVCCLKYVLDFLGLLIIVGVLGVYFVGYILLCFVVY